jgi:hypothetical protein
LWERKDRRCRNCFHRPSQHQKDNLGSLEPFFKRLPVSSKGFRKRPVTLTPISRSMHSDFPKGSSAEPKGRWMKEN